MIGIITDLIGGQAMNINFGEVFGWLLVISLVGTIMNYCVKFINKRFGKNAGPDSLFKKCMKILMTIFVRNHRYFGLAAVILLMIHFLIQFFTYGLNLTGGLAAGLLLIQVILGWNANKNKKPRKGAWFVIHRSIAVLIVLAVILHLTLPYSLNALTGQNTPGSKAEGNEAAQLQTFTLEELATYNGENGNKAYIAYDGLVYDVTDIPQWKNGKHNGQVAGTDVTGIMENAPHGTSMLDRLEVVGELK